MISYFLTFCRFRRIFPSSKLFCGITRIEIDFSKALLAGCVFAFNGTDVATYLKCIWNVVVNGRTNVQELMPIHICRFHSLRFLSEYVRLAIQLNNIYKVSLQTKFHGCKTSRRYEDASVQ